MWSGVRGAAARLAAGAAPGREVFAAARARYARGKTHWTLAHRTWLANWWPILRWARRIGSCWRSRWGRCASSRIGARRSTAPSPRSRSPGRQPAVARLSGFRGIDTHAAMVLSTELGDWQRFAQRPAMPISARSRAGLDRAARTPRAHHQGRQCLCRHVLVQAAWTYRHRPPSVPPYGSPDRVPGGRGAQLAANSDYTSSTTGWRFGARRRRGGRMVRELLASSGRRCRTRRRHRPREDRGSTDSTGGGTEAHIAKNPRATL